MCNIKVNVSPTTKKITLGQGPHSCVKCPLRQPPPNFFFLRPCKEWTWHYPKCCVIGCPAILIIHRNVSKFISCGAEGRYFLLWLIFNKYEWLRERIILTYVSIGLLVTYHWAVLWIRAQLATEWVHGKCSNVYTFYTGYEIWMVTDFYGKC